MLVVEGIMQFLCKNPALAIQTLEYKEATGEI